MDRGPSSYLSNVDVFLDGHLITTVQGDGECCWALLEGKQLHFTGTANTSVQRMGVSIPTVKL